MKTTKRTTANFALDASGEKIRLLATRAREPRISGNVLTYEEIRYAVQENLPSVEIVGGFGANMVLFGLYSKTGTSVYNTKDEKYQYIKGPVYRIGCHYFTLKMFNRILRAAGVRTTKQATQKRFSTAAGQ